MNKKKIGPKLLLYDKDYFVYGFIEGIGILDFIKTSSKKTIIKIIKNLLNQLFVMDQLKINKEEMSHPHKHIIIDKKSKPHLIDAKKSKISGISKTVPVLIDFERCRKTVKPSNVTQFCDYLISDNILKTLKIKNIKINKNEMIELAKKYKRSINENNFKKILKILK